MPRRAGDDRRHRAVCRGGRSREIMANNSSTPAPDFAETAASYRIAEPAPLDQIGLVPILSIGASVAGSASTPTGARHVLQQQHQVGRCVRCPARARCRSPRPCPAPSRIPAVSVTTTFSPPRSSATSTRSRVVPGSSVTIATSRRANALSRLDFPAFGAPSDHHRIAVANDLRLAKPGDDAPRSRRPAPHVLPDRVRDRTGHVALVGKIQLGLDHRPRMDDPLAPPGIERALRAAGAQQWQTAAAPRSRRRSGRPAPRPRPDPSCH